MLETNNIYVLDAYQHLKNSGKLSVNLENPTTANLRNECAVVFSKRPNDRVREILSGFGSQLLSSGDIRSIDADKFRPLKNFIIGEIDNPSTHTVELLAWLIDFKEEGQSGGGQKRQLKFKQWLLQAAAVALMGVLVYWVWPKKQCMYWDGKAYQKISCDDGAKAGLKVVMLNEKNLTHFRRITQIDTIHYKDIGRVWYMKINGVHEFYTAAGMHPIEEKKQLKPITKFIIYEHILAPIDTTAVNLSKSSP